MVKNDLNSKIGQATRWSATTEIIAKLISPLVNMVLARLLTPNEFGVVATITMVISFAEIFTDAGFQKYLIQHEFRDVEELNKNTNVAFWTNLFVSGVICVIIFFFRDSVARLVGNPALGKTISVSSILIIIAAFSSVQMARYKRDFDFKTLFFVRVGTCLVPLVVTLPLAFVLRNYWALLIGNFASQLFNAIVLTVKSKWRPSLFYSFKILKEMLSFSIWTFFEMFFFWLTLNVGIFIVGHYLDDYYLGLYKTSMTVVNSYVSIISAAIIPVLFSALSRYQNDEVNFMNTYYTFQRMAAILLIPMGVGIYMYSDLVTLILLGKQWMEASGFIGLWGLTSAIVMVYANFAGEVYRSKGHPKIALGVQVLHLIFVVPTIFFTVEQDFKILYTARALVRVQMIITSLILMHVLYKFIIKDVIKNTFPMIISTSIMACIAYVLKKFHTSIGWQIGTIIICGMVYFLVLFICFPKIRREVFKKKYNIRAK